MATISIIRVENPAEKAEISAHILHALPDWSVCRTARRSISTTAETCRFSPPCRKIRQSGLRR